MYTCLSVTAVELKAPEEYPQLHPSDTIQETVNVQKFFKLYQFQCCLLPSIPTHMGDRSQLALVLISQGWDLGSLCRIKNLPNPLVDKLETDVPSRGS